MLTLSLVWLVVGMIVGALANGARLRPETWGPRGWLAMLGLGALAGLAGGWLGTFIYGRYFGTAMALWIAVVVVAAGPAALRWVRGRMKAKASTTSQP